MEDWVNFFDHPEFFNTSDEAKEFVEKLECLGPENPRHKAKIMMHQTQRLVSIADALPKIRPEHEPAQSLQLLFLLICAEHIAKLHAREEQDGQSRKYTQQFFNKFLNENDKQAVIRGFRRIPEEYFPDPVNSTMSLSEVVSLLYDIRCGVVHEGNYWDFHFHDGNLTMINTDPDIEVSITFPELRNCVVRGCIKAIKTYGNQNTMPIER